MAYKKTIFTLLGVFLLLAGAVYYGVEHVAPYAIIMPYRPPPDDVRFTITPTHGGMAYSSFTVATHDSLQLDCWFVPATGDSLRGTVLLLHGIGDTKASMLGGAASLVQAGYNVVLYDSRAHGRSTGRYCTYGFYEKRDVSRVLDEVVRLYGGCEPFGIMGSSFGGAVAVQALAADKRLRCGIVESTFTVLGDIVYAYQQQMLGIPFRWVADEALAKACTLAQFSADSVCPECSAARVEQPVLVVHGTADERINITHGRRIFQALASPHKQWLAVSGAGHLDVAQRGGEMYQQAKLSFLNQWLR